MTRRLRLALVGLFAVAFTLGFAAPSHATAPPVHHATVFAQTAPSSDDVATIDLDQTGVLLVTGLLLPVVVGLAVKYSASSKLKAIVNTAAAGLASLIVNATDDRSHAVLSLAQLRDWFILFAISTVTYLGLAQKLDINAKLGKSFGLGRTT